jgi:cyanophycin synthetase
VQRLRAGTYAGHIVEHVALELQCLAGDTVGFGQTRGTGVVGEYTIAFEHRHEQVGLRAAACALDIVQHAFAGTLVPTADHQQTRQATRRATRQASRTTTQGATPHQRAAPMIDRMLAELRALRRVPDIAPTGQTVYCTVTGSRGRAALCDELSHQMLTRDGADDTEARVIDVAPSYILHAGLPYARSTVAVILDAALVDVPLRYRDPERSARLVATVAEAIAPGGAVICPNDAHYVHDAIRAAGATAIKFAPSLDVHEHVRRAAAAVAEWRHAGVPSTTLRSHGAA